MLLSSFSPKLFKIDIQHTSIMSINDDDTSQQRLLHLDMKPATPSKRPRCHGRLSCMTKVVYILGILAFSALVVLVVLQANAVEPLPTASLWSGEMLRVVQNSYIYNDSKTFVDMPANKDPQLIWDDFYSLPDHNNDTIRAFVDRNFDEAGSDVLLYPPEDWQSNPSIIDRIKDPNLKQWAMELNAIWKDLGRTPSADVYIHPDRHTLLGTKHKQMLVPGGRFREFYYWDTYWIVKGLLLSDMNNTARIIVENLLYFIGEYGYMPNGNRIYYLTRSQPPFLTLMVNEIYIKTRNTTFVSFALPLLDVEYEYFMKTEHSVVITASDGSVHELNRYYSNAKEPRPESYREDIATALEFDSNDEKDILYGNIIAAAESGWDFSSRWLSNGVTIDTNNIIPVDLNSILYKVECILADLNHVIEEYTKEVYYSIQKDKRKHSIHQLLYSNEKKQYFDYHIPTMKLLSNNIYMSNFSPLWSNAFDSTQVDPINIINTLESNLLFSAGFSTSNIKNNPSQRQQWDFPNAWSPLQEMAIQSIFSFDKTKAKDIAQTWISSNYDAYMSSKCMFEKYNATHSGMAGSGGEYEVVKGFGWTNGVVFILLDMFGDSLVAPPSAL